MTGHGQSERKEVCTICTCRTKTLKGFLSKAKAEEEILYCGGEEEEKIKSVVGTF